MCLSGDLFLWDYNRLFWDLYWVASKQLILYSVCINLSHDWKARMEAGCDSYCTLWQILASMQTLAVACNMGPPCPPVEHRKQHKWTLLFCSHGHIIWRWSSLSGQDTGSWMESCHFCWHSQKQEPHYSLCGLSLFTSFLSFLPHKLLSITHSLLFCGYTEHRHTPAHFSSLIWHHVTSFLRLFSYLHLFVLCLLII